MFRRIIMNQILGIFVDIVLPILVLLVGIGIAILIYFSLRKVYKKPLEEKLIRNEIPQVKIKQNYCTEEEMRFLDALHKALPRDCISFPLVGVSRLIEPKGNLNDYKAIMDQFVDICVFLRKDMKPILVIDLYSPSPVAQQLKRFDENVTRVLKQVKIPVLHKQIQTTYNISDLSIEVLQAMNNDTVAYLKDKTIKDNVKKS